MNGLVLDTSALLKYASGKSIEPGAMLTLADEDPSQEVWVAATCLAQAHRMLAGTAEDDVLDVLFTEDRDIGVAVLDIEAARRVARIAARFERSLDVAHALDTAVLYRCFIVTAAPETITPTGLEMLDISEGWH